MKNLFLFVVTAFVLCGCSKEEFEISPKEVDVKLDYTFVESGSMTRAGSDVYNAFYDKYIKTKKLAPKTYSLKFKNKETSEIVLSLDGKWGENNSVRLPEGEYNVSGQSMPIMPRSETLPDGTYYPSDSVYMSFNEDVKITKDMEKMTLTAIYDSFLLLFDSENIEKINLGSQDSKYNDEELSNDGDNIWLFVRDKSYSKKSSTGSTTYYTYFSLYLSHKTGDLINVYLKDLPTEKGKYYYFNDMTNSFDIPQMESGN